MIKIKINGDIAAHEQRVLHTHAMGYKGRFLREQTNTYLYENIFDHSGNEPTSVQSSTGDTSGK